MRGIYTDLCGLWRENQMRTGRKLYDDDGNVEKETYSMEQVNLKLDGCNWWKIEYMEWDASEQVYDREKFAMCVLKGLIVEYANR